jgi:hypothetical protein
MAKLIDLVRYRTFLKALDIGGSIRKTLDVYNDLWHTINKENPIERNEFNPTANLLPGMQSMKARAEQIEQDIERDIKELEGIYYTVSDEAYTAGLHDSDDYILNRQIPLTVEALTELTNKIKTASDWKYPGMFIRPGHRTLVEEMASSDPLYIVDTSAGLLAPALSQFLEDFQTRIRNIVLVDERKPNILKDLPEGQMGLIVCLDFFEYRPLHLVERYLVEFNNCLREGGTLIFSFNNCDIEHGVNLVDKKYRTYTPAYRIKEMLFKLGLTIQAEHDYESSLSWIEAKKPGELKSLRGGQALGQIKPKEIDITD